MNEETSYSKKDEYTGSTKEILLKMEIVPYKEIINSLENDLKVYTYSITELVKKITDYKNDIYKLSFHLTNLINDYYTKKFNKINSNILNKIFKKKHILEKAKLAEQKDKSLDYLENIEIEIKEYPKNIDNPNELNIPLPDEEIINLLQKIFFKEIDKFLKTIESLNNDLPYFFTQLNEYKAKSNETQEKIDQKKNELDKLMKELSKMNGNSTTNDNTSHFNNFPEEFTNNGFKK